MAELQGLPGQGVGQFSNCVEESKIAEEKKRLASEKCKAFSAIIPSSNSPTTSRAVKLLEEGVENTDFIEEYKVLHQEISEIQREIWQELANKDLISSTKSLQEIQVLAIFTKCHKLSTSCQYYFRLVKSKGNSCYKHNEEIVAGVEYDIRAIQENCYKICYELVTSMIKLMDANLENYACEVKNFYYLFEIINIINDKLLEMKYLKEKGYETVLNGWDTYHVRWENLKQKLKPLLTRVKIKNLITQIGTVLSLKIRAQDCTEAFFSNLKFHQRSQVRTFIKDFGLKVATLLEFYNHYASYCDSSMITFQRQWMAELTGLIMSLNRRLLGIDDQEFDEVKFRWVMIDRDVQGIHEKMKELLLFTQLCKRGVLKDCFKNESAYNKKWLLENGHELPIGLQEHFLGDLDQYPVEIDQELSDKLNKIKAKLILKLAGLDDEELQEMYQAQGGSFGNYYYWKEELLKNHELFDVQTITADNPQAELEKLRSQIQLQIQSHILQLKLQQQARD